VEAVTGLPPMLPWDPETNSNFAPENRTKLQFLGAFAVSFREG